MKFSKLFVLSTIPFLLVSCKGNTEQLLPNCERKEVEAEIASNFGSTVGEDTFKEKCIYDDSWFFEDTKEINYELALFSAITGGASYSSSSEITGSKISKLLEATGFSNIEKNYYYNNGITLEDSIGVIIGSKNVRKVTNDNYTLLAVFPRNAGYADEWVGNFNIDSDGVHHGFLLARDEMLRFTKNYIINHNITGKLKVYTAGYSRGAAAVNLFSAYLADASLYLPHTVSLDTKDIYTYTIGTPSTVMASIDKKVALSVSSPREGEYHDTNIEGYEYQGSGSINPLDEKYGYIHNFVGVGDYVTKLPFSKWGFTRYGETNEISFGSEKMIPYLKEYSASTAAQFESGRAFDKKEATSTLNFDTFKIEETSTLMSPNEVLDSHLDSLVNLVPSVEEYNEQGYVNVLGSMLASFGCDYDGFISGLTSNIQTLLSAFIYSYLANVAEKEQVSDIEALQNVIFELLKLLGKEVQNKDEYTDQQLLKDIFDVLINDYHTSEASKTRLTNLLELIPGSAGKLILNIIKFAGEKGMTITYVDDLLLLISDYFDTNKEDQDVHSALEAIVGIIPEKYYVLLWTIAQIDRSAYEDDLEATKASLQVIFHNCVYGVDDTKAYEFRYSMLVAASFGVYSYSKIVNLVLNGSTNNLGEKVICEPAKLSEFLNDVVTLLLLDNETKEVKSFKKAANENISLALDKCKTSKNEKYIDNIKNNVDIARKFITGLLQKEEGHLDLQKDIDNLITLVKSMMFMFPAHFHEMYISYMKSCL